MLQRVFAAGVAYICFFCLTQCICLADDNSAVIHSSTRIESNSRFEIIQSPILARLTFRLDRFSGVVDQLAFDKETNGYSWQNVQMNSNAIKKFVKYNDNRVHFQMFFSGILAKNSFLMDVDTGATFDLVLDKNQNQIFDSVDEN